MNYGFDLSGMPCHVSKTWMETAVGGRQQMQRLKGQPQARALPAHGFLLNVGGGYNPSLLVHEERLLVTMRRWGRPLSVLGEIQNRKVAGARELRDCSGTFQRTGQVFEDLRLFTLRDSLMAVATAWRHGGGVPAAIAILKIVGANIVEAHLQPSKSHEKNWMPCVSDGGASLRFVYSTHPLIALTYRGGRVHPAAPGLERGTLRGGSQLIPYKDGWLSVIHTVHEPAQYIHRLAVFDRNLTRVTLGEPFFFQRLGGIEFCAGIALWEDKYLLSYGVQDKQAFVAEVEPSVIDIFAQPVGHALVMPTPKQKSPVRVPPPKGMVPLPINPGRNQRVEGQPRGTVVPRGAEDAFARLAAMVKPAQPVLPVMPVRVQKR